jgi:hypothetical protein
MPKDPTRSILAERELKVTIRRLKNDSIVLWPRREIADVLARVLGDQRAREIVLWSRQEIADVLTSILETHTQEK